MKYGPDKHDITRTDYLNILFGRAMGKMYRLLFEWWLDVPMARREQERLTQEVCEAMPFLFTEYGGQIVPNEGVRFPPRGGAFVTIAIGHLLLRFWEGLDGFSVWVASKLHPAGPWSDWKRVESVLKVIDRPEDAGPPPKIWRLAQAGPVLRAELPRLQEATSEGQWDLVKRKVNALFPPLLRIR